MTKYEYRIIKSDDSILRTIGAEGWSMCGIQDGKMYFQISIQQVGGNYSKPLEEVSQDDILKQKVNKWIKEYPEEYADIKADIALSMTQGDIDNIAYQAKLESASKKEVYNLLKL